MTARVDLSARSFGTTTGHALQPPRPVTAFDLDDPRSGTTATVLDYGAHLGLVSTPDERGRSAPICLAPADLAAYESRGTNPYMGALVGRYANRIGRGRFRLDGSTVEVARNEGDNHIHGGPIGFDRFVWETISADTDDGSATVRLGLRRPDGDQGFPGAVAVTVAYTLAADGSLTLEMDATTDRPTVINLTNHSYWNLGGAAIPIDDHVLEVAADRYVPVDEEQLPYGLLQPVEGSRFDLRSATRLGDRMGDDGFDHCYVLDTEAPGVRRAATLTHPASGRRLTLHTDQPGIQVYTGNNLRQPRTGLCLEPQRLPDTPNRPSFGTAVLRAGQRYHHVTRFEFSTTGPTGSGPDAITDRR